LIYRKGEGVRDPQKREEGPHLKGKIPKGRIKDSKWKRSTISLSNNIHLIVLKVSSRRIFSSTLGNTARRGSAQVFISKSMIGQYSATNHQHESAVVSPYERGGIAIKQP